MSAGLKQVQRKSAAAVESSDPGEPTPMVVAITQIRSYDGNPRRQRNPAYDEIYTSVRVKKGLDGVLTITRRPGEAAGCYMAKACNTRLQVLHDLYAESQDEAYLYANCTFIPWVSEVEMKAAHLIENDARGDLTFTDRAQAVWDLKAMLEQQSGKRMSQRQLVEALKKQGYQLNQSMLTPMEYALETLLPLIPKALRKGLGRPQINRIRKLEWSLTTLLESAGKGRLARKGTAHFHEVLALYDTSAWTLDPVKHDVVAYLATVCERSVSRVRLDLDTLLGGRDLGPDAPESQSLGRQARPQPEGLVSKPGNGAMAEGAEAPRPAVSLSPAHPEAGGVADPQKARVLMWTLASRLASKEGMTECVLPVPRGPGYIVDLPEAPLFADPRHPTEAELRRVAVWWFLCAVCEQWRLGHSGALDGLLPEEARVRPAMEAVAAGDMAKAGALLSVYVAEPTPLDGFVNHGVTTASDDEFKLMVNLLEAKRRLCALSGQESSRSIWATS
ncbi:MAG: ParB family protein [Gammaproteobacteria bacterium]